MNKLTIPSWYRADYPLHVKNAPTIVHDKIFAQHILSADITDQEFFDRGVTHLSKESFIAGAFPPDKKTYLYKPDMFPNGNPTMDEINGVAENIAFSGNDPKTTKESIITDQFKENDIQNESISYATILPFYKKLSELYGAGAENNNIYGTYDSYDANFNPDFFQISTIGYDPLHPRFINALASQEGARMKARNINPDQWDSYQNTDPFYSTGLCNYSNSLTMMLYSIDGVPKDWLYYGIFETQRKYAAKIDAKTLLYTSPWNQSVTTMVDSHEKNPGWIHNRTGGYWKVPTWHVMAPYQNILFGFLGCLLTQGVQYWEGLPLLSESITNDRFDPYQKPRSWVSTGGNQPSLLPYGEPYYPQYPASGLDEVQIGVDWYSQVMDIVNNSSGVAYASYTTNGDAVSVKTGDPRLFRRGFQNFGQDTILRLAKLQKGIALACESGGKTMIFYTNPYLSTDQTENIVVIFNGNTYPLGLLEGAWPHVFIFDTGGATPSPTATPTVTNNLPNCGCETPDFSIVSITYHQNTTYKVVFDSCNVNPFIYEIKDVYNNVVLSSSIVPTSSILYLDFGSITSDGTYTLSARSTGCNGRASKQFTISTNAPVITPTPTITTTPVVSDLKVTFVANGTGNSVDFGSPGNNYISQDYINQFINFANVGIDVIRLVFKWGDYNPSNGVYRNMELGTAINWVRSLPNNPKVDLLFVPLDYGFKGNDRIPSSELYCDADGNLADCTFGLNTVPSYYSPTATTILNNVYDSLFTYLQTNHSHNIRTLSFAGGPSEEHYMPYTGNYDNADNPCGIYRGIGDYCQSSLNAWRIWLGKKYGVGSLVPYMINGGQYTTTNAPLPTIKPMEIKDNNNRNDYSQPQYRDLSRFFNQGVFDIWKRFYDKVKQHTNFSVEWFIADMYNAQSIIWTYNAGAGYQAMKYADELYHTYNINTDEWGGNLIGTDVFLGTFPNSGKISAIEYDSTDAGNPNGGALNIAHVINSAKKFVDHGGKVIHWALGWTPQQVAQLGSAMLEVRNYVNNPVWQPINRNNIESVEVDTRDQFTNSNFLTLAWESKGNEYRTYTDNFGQYHGPYNARPINIIMKNNGTLDTFYTGPI